MFILLTIICSVRWRQCPDIIKAVNCGVCSCGTSLHYIPLRSLMVLFDKNKIRLNKTGLHMVDTWSVHPNLTLLTSRGCLDVTMRALSREHGELLSD